MRYSKFRAIKKAKARRRKKRYLKSKRLRSYGSSRGGIRL